VILDTSYAGGFGGQGYEYAFLESHVLLAGSSRSEQANMSNGRGIFTNGLTTLWRQLGNDIDTVTYKDVIERLELPRYVSLYDQRT
jgi:hypothetical protein